jgi:hypothetical protein
VAVTCGQLVQGAILGRWIENEMVLSLPEVGSMRQWRSTPRSGGQFGGAIRLLLQQFNRCPRHAGSGSYLRR